MQDNSVDMKVTNLFRESDSIRVKLLTNAGLWHHRSMIQHSYDDMQLIHVDMRDNYVDMYHNYIEMRIICFNMGEKCSNIKIFFWHAS